MRRALATAIGLIAALVCACKPPEDLHLSDKEISETFKLSPLPPTPSSPTNSVADDPKAARLGQILFYDARLSSNGEVSCATCHDPALGFSDGKPLSEGLNTTKRHSQALWNVAHQRWFFWDGRTDSLWSQSLQPIQNPDEMGATPEHVHAVASGDPKLTSNYEELFGPMPTSGDSLDRFMANIGKCLEAYERKLISNDSQFDQFVTRLKAGEAEEEAGLNEEQRRGLKLFVGRGQCILCHSGPNLSDNEFHNIGLPKHPELRKDSGRFEGVRLVKKDPFNGTGEHSDDRSAEANIKLRYLVVKLNNMAEFKTPSLRNVAQTAPYMHDGRFATLREVLNHYSELKDEPPLGHREETLTPLKLSEQEKDALEAFLKTLTGKPLSDDLLQAPQ